MYDYYGNYNPYNNGMMIGGYPQGYPPNMQQYYNSPYSPFMNPQDYMAPQTYVPGANGPIELHRSDGTVDQMNMNTPGGVTVSEGGFDPVSGMNIPPSQVNQGYSNNPYTTYRNQYTPSYNYRNPYNPANMYGYNPYSYSGYPQNEYNTQDIYDLLYNPDAPMVDTMTLLETIVLTDEERKRLEKRRSSYTVAYDYYGRPIYNNGYNNNNERQEMLQECRVQVRDFYTQLSVMCHKYTGDTNYDIEEIQRYYDPVKEPVYQKQKSYYDMTNEEREEYDNNQRYIKHTQLYYDMLNFQSRELYIQNYRIANFPKIKESHDKALGFNPGEHYSLKQYMENGYNLVVDAVKQKVRLQMRDKGKLYSSNQFRQSIAYRTNQPIPINSKDDEFITVEQRLKNLYERNKMNTIMFLPDGTFTYAIAPPGRDQKEYKESYYAMALDRKLKHDQTMLDLRGVANGA